ncbi:hypothetical protein [Saccharopolyspora gloriosae]|uniref:hypothetical protein n=1 Tax=Saccharopolyspora gloriosae TaxID=455344 RepID=UPI001FB5CD18|nr:hypothetical protein [Saccharopolyspora gloriosae]
MGARLLVEPGVEVVLGLPERRGQRAQHFLAHPQHFGLPREGDLPQFRQRRGPLVRADQPLPRRVPRSGRHHVALRSDVELFALIRGAIGEFVPGRGVAAELR